MEMAPGRNAVRGRAKMWPPTNKRGVFMTIPGKPPVPTELVHHIGIAVGDLEASIEFYRDLFGLEAGPIVVREDILQSWDGTCTNWITSLTGTDIQIYG